MSVTAAIRKMLAAGLTIEQALIASDAFEAEGPKDNQAERRRAKDRERKRLRKSAESVESAENPSPKEKSPTPSKEITPSTVSEARASSTEARATKTEFEIWYQHYPHKVQRGAAERAFVKARTLATLEELIAGVDRYKASKPHDRQWQNPATWLNGKGWMDAPADTPQRATAPPDGRERMSSLLDGIKSGAVIVPDLLEHLTGKRHEQPFSGPTIEASIERPDSGGAGHPNQVYAFPSRR